MRALAATVLATFALAGCGGNSTPAGPGVAADYFKQNSSDEAKLAKGCQDLFGNPKDVAALHGVTAPGQYEWQPDFIAGDAQRMSCYLRGPEVGNVTYSLMQTDDPRYAAEGDGRYASDIDSGHFAVANYYRITLSSDQEGKVRDLLNAANANVN